MDSNQVKCKVCQVIKTKIENGLYPNQKTKRYVDEFGKQWSGKTCPECNRTRAKMTMKAARILTVQIDRLTDNED